MKKLQLVTTQKETIVEYHTNTMAVERRKNELCSKLDIESVEITDTIQHVEIIDTPKATIEKYIDIEEEVSK